MFSYHMNAKSVKIVRLTQDLPFIFRLERSSLPKSKLFYAAAPDESVRLNGSIDRWAAADPVLGTFWPLLGDHKRARACRSAFSRCLFPFWDIRRGIKPSLFSFPSFSIYGAFQSTSRSLREREDKRERERERERERAPPDEAFPIRIVLYRIRADLMVSLTLSLSGPSRPMPNKASSNPYKVPRARLLPS